MAKLSFFKFSSINIVQMKASNAILASSDSIYRGFFLQMGDPITPTIAPIALPHIRSIPLVVAGAIGKVNSDAKFIDTEIIGTRKIPKLRRLAPVMYTLR